VELADTTAGPAGPYRALRHVRPYGWIPTFETGGRYDDFIGFWTYGADLVDRHRWQLRLTASPQSGQTQGSADYTFAGLPVIPGLDMHPAVTLAASRNWDLAFEDRERERYIDEREDVAQVILSLARARWRARTSVSLAGERVWRSRDLHGFGPQDQLRDPMDDLLGIRGSVVFSSFILPPFAISRENGVVLQATARERSDRAPTRFVNQQGTTVTLDGSYREYSTWNAGYLALPLPGFARHVLAVRGSGLLREGPGAGTSGVGGASGAPFGLALPGGSDVGGASRLLPIRGFPENARRGTRAWTASAEYRLPLLVLATSFRPLPIFADRLSGAAFLDAGHAWCGPADAARLPAAICPSQDATDPPLLAAGAEFTMWLSIYGAQAPVRAGFGLPLAGTDNRELRFHILVSPGF
jgi:hypothetical protein